MDDGAKILELEEDKQHASERIYDLESMALELAAAVDCGPTDWGPDGRIRRALDAIWSELDPSGSRKEAELQRSGCAFCEGPVPLGYDVCESCGDYQLEEK